MSSKEYIDRFLAVSYLYLQLTGKSPVDINVTELEDLLEIINDGHCPTACPDQYVA